MTAPARPQTVVDTINTNIAEDRARVTELVAAYRDITGRLADPIAAYAAVAGAAYQSMCSRQATQVLAPAVQVIVEMQDAGVEKGEAVSSPVPDGYCHCGNELVDGCCYRPNCPPFDIVTGKPVEAVRAGVDRHWGPLAATGGEHRG